MLMRLNGTLILILVFISFHSAVGQLKNIMLDEQQDTSGFVCEPTIAINPRDTKNIVAGAVLDNLYFTEDGGETWTKAKLVSPFGVYGDPALAVDSKGNFYYFHLSDPTGGKGGYDTEKLDRIVVQKSGDGGATWTEGESIGFNHPKDQDKEWAAVDTRGNVYVSWTQFDKYGEPDPACHSNILFSMTKNGRKWTEPVVISGLPGNCLDDDSTAEGAVPAATFDGKVFIAWANGGHIYLDRSFDGGYRWLSNDIRVTEQPGGWDMKIPGHDRCNGMPVLMTDGSKSPYRGSLYIVWADQRNGEDDTDIWFTRSVNFGDNWATPLRVNRDGEGKHQYLPWMAVDSSTGYIYIVYYDRRNYDDSQTDVYLAYSTDGGASFREVRISEKPFIPQDDRFFGDYNNIAAHDGVITPIWTRMDNGKTSVWTAIIKQEDLIKPGSSK
ncbi:MAG TPA: sialidase family protein [Chryseosolibacter sp.]